MRFGVEGLVISRGVRFSLSFGTQTESRHTTLFLLLSRRGGRLKLSCMTRILGTCEVKSSNRTTSRMVVRLSRRTASGTYQMYRWLTTAATTTTQDSIQYELDE